MKIKKHQDGSQILYTPVFRNESSKENVSTENKNKNNKPNSGNDDFKEQIFSIIKESGLPNDVEAMLSEGTKLLNESESIGYSLIGDSSKGMGQSSKLINLFRLANQIKHNKSLHTSAVARLTTENTGSDVAISDVGSIYVIKDGGLSTISPSSYHKDPSKYSPLTNSQLLNFREKDKSLAFDNTILTNLSGSIGMDKISDHIKGVISSLGTVSSKTRMGKKAEIGLNKIQNDPNLAYKTLTSESHKGFDPKDVSDLNYTVSYIYDSLTDRMKKTLKANTALEGLDPNNSNDVKRFLAKAVIKGSTHDYEEGFEEQEIKDGSDSSSGSGSDKTDEIGYQQQIMSGYGNPVKSILMGRGDHTRALGVDAVNNRIKGSDGKAINLSNSGYAPAEEVYKNSIISNGLSNSGFAYYGGVKIPSKDFDKIIIQTDTGVDTVMLPVDNSGKPNLLLSSQIENVKEKTKNLKDINKIRNIFEEENIPYDENSNDVDYNRIKRGLFLGYKAITSMDEDYFEGNDLDFVETIEKSELKSIIDGVNRGRESGDDFDLNLGTFWNTEGVTGMMYVPLNIDNTDAAISEGRGHQPKKYLNNIDAGQKNMFNTSYNNGLFSGQRKLVTNPDALDQK